MFGFDNDRWVLSFFSVWCSTPDFITPIEQQFPVHFDVNKVKSCYTSPPWVPNCFLSSMRASFECGFCLLTCRSHALWKNV